MDMLRLTFIRNFSEYSVIEYEFKINSLVI